MKSKIDVIQGIASFIDKNTISVKGKTEIKIKSLKVLSSIPVDLDLKYKTSSIYSYKSYLALCFIRFLLSASSRRIRIIQASSISPKNQRVVNAIVHKNIILNQYWFGL